MVEGLFATLSLVAKSIFILESTEFKLKVRVIFDLAANVKFEEEPVFNYTQHP